MNRTMVTVHYRSDTKAPDEFCDAVVEYGAACLVVRETLSSYGPQRRSTFIPWDLIDQVVVE